MLSSTYSCLLAVALGLTATVSAQTTSASTTSGSGYVGYNLTLEGDEDSVVYSTEDTRPDAGVNEPNPDVFLNASVSVGEIDIEVDNLRAQIDLNLQVLQLLQFNAGVDLSIDRVRLLIENVTAKVLLEARLENVVMMVDDVLNSIDLNPVIAELGNDVGSILNNTGDAVGGVLGGLTGSGSNSTANTKRSFDLEHNILYSINDYSGNTHTNRILSQNGDIVEQDLNNDGDVSASRVVGSYAKDMTFNGHEDSVTRDGQQVQSRQYTYSPIHGISIIAAVYVSGSGSVVGTQVLSELEAGGSSTISDL